MPTRYPQPTTGGRSLKRKLARAGLHCVPDVRSKQILDDWDRAIVDKLGWTNLVRLLYLAGLLVLVPALGFWLIAGRGNPGLWLELTFTAGALMLAQYVCLSRRIKKMMRAAGCCWDVHLLVLPVPRPRDEQPPGWRGQLSQAVKDSPGVNLVRSWRTRNQRLYFCGPMPDEVETDANRAKAAIPSAQLLIYCAGAARYLVVDAGVMGTAIVNSWADPELTKFWEVAYGNGD